MERVDYLPGKMMVTTILPRKKPLRVLSLFDGIGTGLLILDRLGLVVSEYFASEIDEDAIRISRVNLNGRIKEIGDITKVDNDQLKGLGQIDLLIGGSPCNELSLANPNRRGLLRGTGLLFFDYFRALTVLKRVNPKLLFLFENTANMPKKYSKVITLALLSVGFFLQAAWSGVLVCSGDIVVWSSVLGLLNLGHTLALTVRLIPPPLSPELTELYVRMFSPLKVSRKHFKELTREANVMILDSGDAYAIEDVTNADERLSILLKGKLKVSCDNMHLHYISSYQFIDSPEWEAGHVTSDELFQVTITAEEDSMYLCWPKLKLDRVLRHRPILKVIISNLIGKDITQKLYWLNEAVGLSGGLGGKEENTMSCDHWRRVMPRSLSVDAVDTGTRGHVRSIAWRKQANNRSDSLVFSDNQSPSRGPQCWIPVVANHFMERSPFLAALPQPLPPIPAVTTPSRSSLKRPREVKFEESNV